MTNKEVSGLLGLAVFILLVVIIEYNTNSKAISDCNQEIQNSYSCIVLRKETIEMDHGLQKIYCYDYSKDSSFIFYPYYTFLGNRLYNSIDVFDTLIKSSHSNTFYILGKEGRDSMMFDCSE